MPSINWRALGAGNLLGNLRSDLQKASKEVSIVGPWIDAFFAEVVIGATNSTLPIRILTRPLSSMSASFLEHATAARQRFKDRGNTEIRTLLHLHAKVILIDETIAYCGSANWYRYSLEESAEIVLRGDCQEVPTLLDELTSLWDQASSDDHIPTVVSSQPSVNTSEGYQDEVIDPIAAAKMAEVPKSFVLRRKTPHLGTIQK